ncbi:hypothetical protein [Paraburkholderia sp. UCT2]|uniref:hypothetical protein n=1 Tax=Paraburkholderia sp. UCT2 TaxID=2615208 RepID=UPI0016567143|nr:hypothetical protein [Paraburkholderia sp. UCT2]MBC8732970.1 hypothetical protein [Paraburkholderia sp. UCT2]
MNIRKLLGAKRAGTRCGNLWFDVYFYQQGAPITSASRTDKDVTQVSAVMQKLPIHDYQFVIKYKIRPAVLAQLNGSGGAVYFKHSGQTYTNEWDATLELFATDVKTWKEDAASFEVNQVPPMQIDVVSGSVQVHGLQSGGGWGTPAPMPVKQQLVSITVV